MKKLEMIKNAIWALYPFVKIEIEQEHSLFTHSFDYRMSFKWCFRGNEHMLIKIIREEDELIGNFDTEWITKDIINDIQRTIISGLIKKEK